MIADASGRVATVKLVKNELHRSDDGSLRPRATERYEQIPAGLVFRSVGYHGVPIADVPFHNKWGVIPNEKGRVIDHETQQRSIGEYAAGWIKRGPSGLIGTNKADAVETVSMMLEDLEAGELLSPSRSHSDHAAELIHHRQPDHFTYEHWQRLDAHETDRGKQSGRPRVKLTHIDEMLSVRDRQ